jgi:hypothetical protein
VLPAVSTYDGVLALHIAAVVVAFGWIFALPVFYLVARRHSPRALPLLHRIEYTAMRLILNPALVVVLGAGIYLAADRHRWDEFFVQWGLGAMVVIGAIAGSVTIPLAKRAEQAALGDLAAPGEGGEPRRGAAYRRAERRLVATGAVLWVLVLATVVIMTIKP